MANFELSIDRAKFQHTGVQPVFDENLYGELLDEFLPEQAHVLRVKLEPHPAWGVSMVQRAVRRASLRTKYNLYGEYKNSGIWISCIDDVIETNDTLLHETKHYLNDIFGTFSKEEVSLKYQRAAVWAGSFATSAAAFGIGAEASIPAQYPVLIAGTVLATSISANRYLTDRTAEEISAQDFAVLPEVVEAYGQVIKYRQAS